MRQLFNIIIPLLTLSTCVFGQDINSKQTFNGILIGKRKCKLSSHELNYRQEFKRKSPDSTIYSFEFQAVESIGTLATGTQMLITKNEVFIGASFLPVLDNQYQFEKLMDFGLKSGESWTVNNLFCFNKSVITFELKYFDDIPKDTIYQFKVDGEGLCSHTDPVKRIYGSKRLGLVRVDYFLPPSSFHKNIYDEAIFVSADYLERGRIESFYKNGLIRNPK